MKKRVLTLLLAGMLVLSATACGSADGDSASASPVQTEAEAEAPAEAEAETKAAEETEPAEEEDVFEKALENARNVESMELQMVMDMSMQASQDGEEQSADFVMNMDMACINDPFKLKMETTVDAGTGEEPVTISIYGEVGEDGTATAYMNDGTGWQSQTVGKTDLVQYDASANMLGSIDTGSEYTADGMEEVDGANAYKYAHTMSGEEAKEAILSSGALDSLTSAGIDPSQFESAMGDIGELTEYIWIDEATLYPVKYEIDMTEVMAAMMDSVLESMGDEAEGVSMSFSKMKMTMHFSNFNSVEDFEMPGNESEN